jgi:hypothetical protein
MLLIIPDTREGSMSPGEGKLIFPTVTSTSAGEE